MHSSKQRTQAFDPEASFWALAAFTAAHASDPKRVYLALADQFLATRPDASAAEREEARTRLQSLLGMGQELG